jgi:hypothetical protein
VTPECWSRVADRDVNGASGAGRLAGGSTFWTAGRLDSSRAAVRPSRLPGWREAQTRKTGPDNTLARSFVRHQVFYQ